jgi:hypothetical protein
LASNNLGELVLPDGWSIKDKGWSYQKYVHADGREQKNHPGKPEGVIALANAIPDMRALSTLIFGGDGKVWDGNNWVPAEPATLELGITVANFSNKNLRAGGAITISAWLTHKDNGAMTSLNLSSNSLCVEGAKIVAAFLPKCT